MTRDSDPRPASSHVFPPHHAGSRYTETMAAKDPWPVGEDDTDPNATTHPRATSLRPVAQPGHEPRDGRLTRSSSGRLRSPGENHVHAPADGARDRPPARRRTAQPSTAIRPAWAPPQAAPRRCWAPRRMGAHRDRPHPGPQVRRCLTPTAERRIHAAFGKVYADLARMEDIIRDSGPDWTVVRPPRLRGKPPAVSYRTAFGQTFRGGWSVPRADVAQFMLAVLGWPGTIHQTIGIAN